MGGMALLRVGTLSDGRQAVLRELRKEHTFKWRIRKNFIRGTRIREVLCPHPNIVEHYDFGRRGLIPYEIIEYVHGKNLQQLVERSPDFVRENTIEILKQAARCLAHMHSNRFLHLDIKPHNFLIQRAQEGLVVKLTDFDLSCDCNTRWNRRRAGTVKYMAPEELKHGSVDVGTDVFAFGALAYLTITLRYPFGGATVEESRRNQLSRKVQVVPPSKVVKDVHPKLDWLIVRCLEKDARKRLPSIAYFVREMERH